MKRISPLVYIVLAGLFLCSFLHTSTLAAPLPNAIAHSQISGPYQSGNLAVYLIHGQDKVKSQNILTLGEALAQKKLIVHETSDVNQLAVENLSTAFVFIQSGEIVKGGKQDRTMQYDLLVPPHSGKMPLPAFCVEHDRWNGRAGESSSNFEKSSHFVSGKSMKAAIQGAQKALPPELQGATYGAIGSQEAVWQSVNLQQGKLQRNIGGFLSSLPSPSSMQLTLENKKVAESSAQHVKQLSKLVDDKSDAIGYAVAINGKINSADVYASHELFKKLWPKLLNSSAAEAVAEVQNGKKFAQPSSASVDSFLKDVDRIKMKSKVALKESRTTEQESNDAYSYKCQWHNAPTQVQVTDKQPIIHSNYLAK